MFAGLKTNARSAIAVLTCCAVMSAALGCTPQQQANAKAVVAKLISYEPEVQTAVDTVASVVETLAPPDAALISGADTIFDQALAELDAAAKAYASTPTASALATLNSVLQTLLSTNSTQFLSAAHISDPASVAIAKTAIAGVRVILLLMDNLLSQLLPPATVSADLRAQPIHLRDIAPYVDASAQHRVEVATGHSYRVAYAYASAQGL